MSVNVIRRQPHGIKVEQITLTISREEMSRLRREAQARGVTVSRYVVDLVRLAWSVQGAIGNLPESSEDAGVVNGR